jgi:hypothetical protein
LVVDRDRRTERDRTTSRETGAGVHRDRRVGETGVVEGRCEVLWAHEHRQFRNLNLFDGLENEL